MIQLLFIFADKSLKGWKEVEYEVVRDAFDNCITVRKYNQTINSLTCVVVRKISLFFSILSL